MVDGFEQDPIDGVSMAYTFAEAKAPARKPIQYFDNNGSRGIYHDGWYACTFGPLTPWLTVSPGLSTWADTTHRSPVGVRSTWGVQANAAERIDSAPGLDNAANASAPAASQA